MKALKTLAAVSAIAMVVGTANSQTSGPSGQHGTGMQGTMQSMMPTSSDSSSTKDYKSVHMKMMMNAPKDFSGDADVDFVRQMIVHHQGGIEMARVELQHGKDAKMRQTAAKIIADQQRINKGDWGVASLAEGTREVKTTSVEGRVEARQNIACARSIA